MKLLKGAIIVLICLVFWFAIDFTLTSLGLGPWKINNFSTGMKHDVYHHDLKPNLNNKARWGNVFYQICTNEFGFKISCDNISKPSPKAYDIAFMGDSFTEAVGMAYEDSFVGMYAAQNPEVSVVNLGCISYAPSIYYKKIEYLLQQGFSFKHVIVAIDIGDIQDEAIYYAISEDGSRVIDKAPTKKVREKKVVESNKPTKQATITDTRSTEQFFTKKYFEYTWYLNLILDALLRPELGLKEFDTFPYRSAWTHSNVVGSDYGAVGVAGGKAQAVESMTKLKKLLDAHNIKMSVLVYPWPAQLMYAPRSHKGVTLWKNFCEKVHCENFINANDIFYDGVESTSLEQVINENYIRGDFHFNKKGNALITSVLQEYIK